MIELTDEEAQATYSAITIGLTSFMKREGLQGMSDRAFQNTLEEYPATKKLLDAITKGRDLIEEKANAKYRIKQNKKDRNKKINSRFEIIDL